MEDPSDSASLIYMSLDEKRAFDGVAHEIIEDLPSLTRMHSVEYFSELFGDNDHYIPFKDWDDEMIIEAVFKEPKIIRLMSICFEGRVTQELADSAFIANVYSFEYIPTEFYRKDYWIVAAKEVPHMFIRFGLAQRASSSDKSQEVYDFEFWKKCLDESGYHNNVFFEMPKEMQTEELVLKFMDKGFLSMKTSYLHPDALTDRVLAQIIKTKLMIERDDMYPEEAERGMRQLLAEGFPSVFERHNIAAEDRTVEKLFELCSDVYRYPRDRDHYATLAELKQFKPEEVAKLVVSERHAEIFKKVYGQETAFSLLGEKASNLRSRWVRDEFGL